MGAHFFQLAREFHVVFQRILVAFRIEDVARVTHGRLAHRVRPMDGFHGHAQVGQIIERVEDSENIHAAGGGVFDEAGDDVVGIIGITDGVAAAKEHLETDVGNFGAQLAQAFPRILVEKTHRGVEGGPAPHLDREQAGGAARDRRRDRQHVIGADARGHQRLVGIAKRRVRDQQAFLFQRPFGKLSGAQFVQQIAGAIRSRRPMIIRGRLGDGHRLVRFVALGMRVAVDNHVADETEQFAGAVALGLE